MSLLPVPEALARVIHGIEPLSAETAGLEVARRRVLAEDLRAQVTQPPFDSAAMDGYAVRSQDAAKAPVTLTLAGVAAAGRPFEGFAGEGQAVRIFTGAPVPSGCDAIIIQENARRDGDKVAILAASEPGRHIRPKGSDFTAGDVLLSAGRRLTERDIMLAAAMNYAALPVRRKPKVAILATGDELLPPGGKPGHGQIISSVPFGLMGLVEQAGGQPELLGIAGDRLESLAGLIGKGGEADILVTIGGASVGEHDLVREALESSGLILDFWKVAIRPGKPLMSGRLGRQRVLGLPGNPVSAFVCARLFLCAMIASHLGIAAQPELARAKLGAALPPNGEREHYLRARLLKKGFEGETEVFPLPSQDSSLMAALAQAGCLIVRPPFAPAAQAGEAASILPLD